LSSRLPSLKVLNHGLRRGRLTPPVKAATVGELKKMIKKLTIACIMLIVLVAALWIYDVVSDRKHEIAVLKPMTLLEKAPQDYPVSNRESGKILAGEHVAVLRMGYGKDFRAWKVRGSVGQVGWFIEENGSIKLMNNGKYNQ
jgi:hypothetical protein